LREQGYCSDVVSRLGAGIFWIQFPAGTIHCFKMSRHLPGPTQLLFHWLPGNISAWVKRSELHLTNLMFVWPCIISNEGKEESQLDVTITV